MAAWNYSFLIVFGLMLAGNAQKDTRPNIIYILADDLGYGDLSCYGQQKFKTPNIDRLAEHGMLFTQHYAGSTVCAPSRSALLTGQTTGHTPVRGNINVEPMGNWPLPAESYTIAEMLQDNGYVTGAFGKWGLGYLSNEGDPNQQGFDEFFGFYSQTLAHHYFPDQLWHNHEKIVLTKNEEGQEVQYAPDLIHQEALRFIEKNAKKPFFLYYASILPHAELKVPHEKLSKYEGQFEPETAYNGVDFGEAKFRQGPYGSSEKPRAAFVSMVEILDQEVGELMAKLEALGLAKNTIVVFTSDNGPHREGGADPDYFDSNGPLRGFKRDLYEGGIRVPMIVQWPGKVKRASQTGHPSAFWDVMPTIADLIGIDVPDNVDGISLKPTLLGKHENQKKHPYLYWEFYELGGRQAIQSDGWKLVKYNLLDSAKTTTELYYLPDDSSESRDLAGENPEQVVRLSNLMKEAHTPSEVFEFKK